MSKIWTTIEGEEHTYVALYSSAGAPVLSAITAAIEATPWDSISPIPERPTVYNVRHCERVPSDLDVVAHVRQLRQTLKVLRPRTLPNGTQQPDWKRPALIVNTTGEDMRKRFSATGNTPIAVSLVTSGSQRYERGAYSLTKKDMAATLIQAAAAKRLKVADGLPLAADFLSQVHGFNPEREETWHVAPYDDLAMSVALAVWWAKESTRHSIRQTKLHGL